MRMIVASAQCVSVDRAIQYTDWIISAAEKYQLPPILLLALYITESELNHRAVSCKGYRGIAQVKPSLPPRENILEGARILREKMSAFPQIERAIGAYKGFGPVRNHHTRKVMRLRKEIEEL
jgi:soluble lytic murein transglycosylase-like protein